MTVTWNASEGSVSRFLAHFWFVELKIARGWDNGHLQMRPVVYTLAHASTYVRNTLILAPAVLITQC